MDTRRCCQLCLILLIAVLAHATVVLASPSFGGGFESLEIFVRPNPVPTTGNLVVEVSGIASCPFVGQPEIGDGTVDIVFDGFCPFLPPTPEFFSVRTTIDPLPPGIWVFRVGVIELSTQQFISVASVSVTVIDPQFSLTLTPSPATADEEVVARVAGQAYCPSLNLTEIDIDRIRIEIHELAGICDPPQPFSDFEFDQPLGQLAVGDYTVELVFEEELVAESSLQILPAGTCIPRERVLCLNDGRFRAEVDWHTVDGESGEGIAVEETADTGLFWFFDEANIELVVKVLDACDTEFESFWVFAGGLTDVGVTLTVTDTETLATAVYENPVGRRFETVADTAAFSACP